MMMEVRAMVIQARMEYILSNRDFMGAKYG